MKLSKVKVSQNVEDPIYTEADLILLKTCEDEGHLSRKSSDDFPVTTAEIFDGLLFRPLHFRTIEDAIRFHQGRAVTVILGSRLKIA